MCIILCFDQNDEDVIAPYDLAATIHWDAPSVLLFCNRHLNRDGHICLEVCPKSGIVCLAVTLFPLSDAL